MEVSASEYINIVSVIVILMLIVVTIFQILYTRSLMSKVSKQPPVCNGSATLLDDSNTIQVYLIDIDINNTVLWNEEDPNEEIEKLKSTYTAKNSRYITYHPYNCGTKTKVNRVSIRTEFNNPEYVVFEGSTKFVNVILKTKFDYMIINGILYYVKFDKEWNSINSRSHPYATERNLFVITLFKVNPDDEDDASQIEGSNTTCVRETITTFTTNTKTKDSSISSFVSNPNHNSKKLIQAMCIPSIS